MAPSRFVSIMSRPLLCSPKALPSQKDCKGNGKSYREAEAQQPWVGEESGHWFMRLRDRFVGDDQKA
ncbi:hypothetical protein HPP92_021218 [Vanilla planifolia]|uniref:Uncharacterized protein n=1 Tax=Vanilla planifolia TaxID=51239 RepID=A0A835PYP9_VANPL|nr:hypothetical protein HPP92_021218 [Vanilla planifolia]